MLESRIVTRQWTFGDDSDTQGLPNLPRLQPLYHETGAHIVHDVAKPAVILVGTGSEVATCLEAAQLLAGKDVNMHGRIHAMRRIVLEQDRAAREQAHRRSCSFC